jgi:ssDNA-binding Zn-finger/Zn-ribbon topoisomerase 1
MHYTCDKCGYGMEKMGKTSKGMKYKCKGCGKTGYVEGMEENAPGGIDPSAFGL